MKAFRPEDPWVFDQPLAIPESCLMATDFSIKTFSEQEVAELRKGERNKVTAGRGIQGEKKENLSRVGGG